MEVLPKKKYWDLDFTRKLNLNEDEWQIRILAELKEAVKLRLVSDVPLGAHLSGGIDSSLIVALMSEVMNKPVKTFSVGFKELEYDERRYARMIADMYETDHHEIVVQPKMMDILPKLVHYYEEPYSDPSVLPTWFLSELSKRYVKVILNGDGGDENFGGYSRYNSVRLHDYVHRFPLIKQIEKLNRKFYQIFKKKIFNKAAKFLHSNEMEKEMFYLQIIDGFGNDEKKSIISNSFENKNRYTDINIFLLSKFKHAHNLDWLDSLLYVDIHSYLVDDLMVKVDIAGMAHSLEIRSPFLDHMFMEMAAQIPSDLKIKRGLKKYILKKASKKNLPSAIIHRGKKGFNVPLDLWFREEKASFLTDRLLGSKFLGMGLFKKKGVEDLIESHIQFKENNSNKLWTLLFLQTWFEEWFKTS